MVSPSDPLRLFYKYTMLFKDLCRDILMCVARFIFPRETYFLFVARYYWCYTPNRPVELFPREIAKVCLHQSFDMALTQWLALRGLDRKFISFLAPTGSRVAGGAMVQCLLGRHWKTSDLDIYCPRSQLQNVHACIKTMTKVTAHGLYRIFLPRRRCGRTILYALMGSCK